MSHMLKPVIKIAEKFTYTWYNGALSTVQLIEYNFVYTCTELFSGIFEIPEMVAHVHDYIFLCINENAYFSSD